MQISHFLKKPDFQLLYINTFASKSSTNITLKQFPHNSEIKADDATLKKSGYIRSKISTGSYFQP